MFSGGAEGLGLDGAKMQEMMEMLQQPNALKDMLSNPELMQESDPSPNPDPNPNPNPNLPLPLPLPLPLTRCSSPSAWLG